MCGTNLEIQYHGQWHVIMATLFWLKYLLKKWYWSYFEPGWKNVIEVISSLAEKILLKLFEVWLKKWFWSYFESGWKIVIEVISSLAEKMLLKLFRVWLKKCYWSYFESEGSRTFSAKFWVLKATLRNLVSLQSINPFLVNFPIIFWFSGVFRGYKMGKLTRNELMGILFPVDIKFTIVVFVICKMFLFSKRL